MDNCEIFTYDGNGNIDGLNKNEDQQNIEHYIFLDDLAGTGTQAETHFKKIHYQKILDINPKANLSYFTLFHTTKSYG